MGMLFCLKKKKPSEEAYRVIANKKNRDMEKRFNKALYSERVIFVPQCLRNVEKCKAKEMGSYYVCAQCNACKVGPIDKKSKELGYKALYILKGGRTVEKLIADLKPKAILGVACFFEGVQGMKESERHNIAVQFVPLTKDGCVNTDLNLEEVFAMLEKVK